ncbi:MAG: enoyl-CoA hydratase/isomerase family protein [Candidatus Lambdaproteobacteria bacterium]|nr:enoyl-CoA hydratase/isomerase family protein [Candidatus Lambdaproteobacteria bacterium]
MATDAVLYDVRKRYAWITLNMPEKRNAFGFPIIQGLDRSLERGLADPDVRGLVISHTGSVFCAGADLKLNRFDREAAGGPGAKSFPETLASIWGQLWSAPKPVIARVGGGAYGAGVGLVCGSDVAFASETAEFAISELRWGRAGAGMVLRLQLKGILGLAHPYCLSGERFGARVAERIGLVHKVVPAGDLDAAVEEYLGKARMCAPGATAQYKANCRALADLNATEANQYVARQSAQMFEKQLAEFNEGKAAFQEKRKPNWAL